MLLMTEALRRLFAKYGNSQEGVIVREFNGKTVETNCRTMVCYVNKYIRILLNQELPFLSLSYDCSTSLLEKFSDERVLERAGLIRDFAKYTATLDELVKAKGDVTKRSFVVSEDNVRSSLHISFLSEQALKGVESFMAKILNISS